MDIYEELIVGWVREWLASFIQHAKNYENSLRHISCPCVTCLNGRKLSVVMVDKHIYRFGFDITYKRWVFPGEPVENTPSWPVPFVSKLVDEIVVVLNDDVGAADPHGIGVENLADVEDPLENNFTDLLSELQVGLYPSYTKYLSLNFTSGHWVHGCSHYESKKLMSKLGLAFETIHTCMYDCTLFWKSYVDL